MNKQGNRAAFLVAGSYTVEAAFVIPMILGIFFAWLFQLFYLHDQVIINGMLQEAAIEREEASGSSGQDVDDRDDISEIRGESDGSQSGSIESVNSEEYSQEQRDRIQSHLWLMDISIFQVKKGISGTKYVLQSEATWNIPVMKRFLKNHFVYRTDVRTESVRPETYVRIRNAGEE